MRKKIPVAFCILALASTLPALQETKVLKPSELQARTVLILKPTINKVQGKCLSYTGELDVIGVGFGDTQGKRQVVLDGKARDVMFWQKTVIRVAHMYDFPAGQMIKVHLRNQMTGAVISNEFEFLNLFCFYSMTPIGPVAPGAVMEIKVKPSAGTGPLGRKIVVGGKAAEILFWHDSTIKFKVPALTPGDHKIVMMKLGQVLSNEYPITVK